MRNEVKTHELVTWSGRNYPLTQLEAKVIRERMEAGAKFLIVPNGTPDGDTVALNDVKGVNKRQLSMSDMVSETKALPEGERVFNPLGPGYIKFLAGGVELALKGKGNIGRAKSKIKDEQIPLVNAELKRRGLEFQL